MVCMRAGGLEPLWTVHLLQPLLLSPSLSLLLLLLLLLLQMIVLFKPHVQQKTKAAAALHPPSLLTASVTLSGF
jgi:hypothetical protein